MEGHKAGTPTRKKGAPVASHIWAEFCQVEVQQQKSTANAETTQRCRQKGAKVPNTSNTP